MKAIYKIIDYKNKIVYVGETIDLERRYYNHEQQLKEGKHPNKLLQKYYNEQDLKFEIEVIIGENIKTTENIKKIMLLLLEKQIILKYKKLGYTILNQEDSLERVIKGDKKLFYYNTKHPSKEEIDKLIKAAREHLKECKLIGNVLYIKDTIMLNKSEENAIKDLALREVLEIPC